jgi:hypothetical protein
MPAYYLSRLPSLQVNAQEEDLQNQDQDLLDIFSFLNTNNWPSHLTQKQIKPLAALVPKPFLDRQKLAWICLEDYSYPRTALWLPKYYYRKEAICEAHD